MWDFRSIKTFSSALFGKSKSRMFCSIEHSITGDIVICQSHAFSKFAEAGSMAPSEILGLFMAIMCKWDDNPSKECAGAREKNTYEKSFFLDNSVLHRYCVPAGTIRSPCAYRIVFNKNRMGEGKKEYCIFSVKKLCSRYLTTDKVHNNRECYLHAGIPDQAALERKAAEAEDRKRKREYDNSELRDLREEVDRLRKKSLIEPSREYHYGGVPTGLMPPPESTPYGSYYYYAPPPGIIPPSYPCPEPPSS